MPVDFPEGNRPLFPAACSLSWISAFMPSQVDPIRVHHLAPRRREVLHELLLGIAPRADLGACAELRIATEDGISAAMASME